jgi:hypothetical protein
MSKQWITGMQLENNTISTQRNNFTTTQ